MLVNHAGDELWTDVACVLQKISRQVNKHGVCTTLSIQPDSWTGRVMRETMFDKRTSVTDALTQIKMDGVSPFPSFRTAQRPSIIDRCFRTRGATPRCLDPVPKMENAERTQRVLTLSSKCKTRCAKHSLFYRRKYSTGTTQKQ